ncbi:P1 family peptidase [Rhodomicrobium sp. Az07]|uniref:P1 family peptidase n=1 Tax=Rhodomicrobium sp. Az07 TaxID=2839034 RepID=UPI001BE6628E|nr:P1 family peptidase [Rhodomicrobium sp. Az07]
MRNLITDVEGLNVGNAEDARIASGTTVILADAPVVAAATVMGGGPGTRERDAISLEGTVGAADAIVLSGGSAFGLDAASGVQIWLRENGRGFQIGPVRVPIVPQAILFDLINGGNKDWGRAAPYRELGFKAAEAAAGDFALGSAGAGYGATVARGAGLSMRGGLGSASEHLTFDGGSVVVGALAAVNAAGAVTVADTPHFWAAPYERGGEFGGLGLPHPLPAEAARPVLKYGALAGANTTLCVVATDAPLTQMQAKRVATMAAAGMARAIHPVFSPLDGDIVFALATGRAGLSDRDTALPFIGAAAANCLARAIARGVHEASASLPDGTQSYRNLFASA